MIYSIEEEEHPHQLKENISHAQESAKTSSWTYDIQKDEYFYTNKIFKILGCRFEEFDVEYRIITRNGDEKYFADASFTSLTPSAYFNHYNEFSKDDYDRI